MTLINLLVAPIRRVVNFPLFQLMTAIAVILLLQAADSRSVFGEIFSALDLVVDFTVRLCASIFEVKSFTKSWLTTGFMIVYVTHRVVRAVVGRDYRRPAAGVHAFPRTDLAGQDGKSVGGGG